MTERRVTGGGDIVPGRNAQEICANCKLLSFANLVFWSRYSNPVLIVTAF